MFREAGFGIDERSDRFGRRGDVTVTIGRGVGYDEKTPWVFVTSTAHVLNVYVPFTLGTNGVMRPQVISSDPDKIYPLLVYCLNQIGIPAESISPEREGTSLGQWYIYVPPKNF